MSIYSGKKLSQVPFLDIYVGLKIISARGTPGLVSGTTSPGYKDEDNDIQIIWDNGKISGGWHFQMDKVTLA